MCIITSCNSSGGKICEENLYHLYRQRIDNSNYVFYQYAYSGGFAFSSDHFGSTVIDSSDKFCETNFTELPSTIFKGKPSNNNFNIISIRYKNSQTTPADTSLKTSNSYSLKIDDIRFKVEEYFKTYGSATKTTGLMEYRFSGFKETSDSLYFQNIVKVFGGKVFKQNQAFEKGNIKIVEANDSVKYIEVLKPIIERGPIYEPTDPFLLVENRPIIGTAFYKFYPTNKILSSQFSDYGIWKEVKLNNIKH